MISAFLFRALLWQERLTQPKGKENVSHQSLGSSTYLGSPGVGSENGAKSSLPWGVPKTQKSYSYEMWRIDPHTAHVLLAIKHKIKISVDLVSFLGCAWYPKCSAWWVLLGKNWWVHLYIWGQVATVLPCHRASHGEGTSPNHWAAALPDDVWGYKSFYSPGQRIFCLVPFSPHKLKVRVSLQRSPSHGEQQTWMWPLTGGELSCTRICSFFKHILTKNKRNSLYTQTPDRPGLYTPQKAEEQEWGAMFLDHCDNKGLFSHTCLDKVWQHYQNPSMPF